MATTAITSSPNFSFPGPIGTKRRRMRSGGNVSTITNNTPNPSSDRPGETADGASAPPTPKCKATAIPIFLKKTYKMIDTCNPAIASWTPDGEMFVVKDPDTFATEVIPQYFDHNKFSSFARQLNFYGFRKMQSKPIRNSDFDAGTAKHVTFFNENFKRGRCDLLKNIQRSTRGGGSSNQQDQQKEVQHLKERVAELENKVSEMESEVEERMRRLELDMLARMEQMMLAMQHSQQQQKPAMSNMQPTTSVGSSSSNSQNTASTAAATNSIAASAAPQQQQTWDSTAFGRFHSIGSAAVNQSGNTVTFQQPAPVQKQQQQNNGGPTLPPHPKQKQFPGSSIMPPTAGNPGRLNSLRGISALSRGISGLSRGASIESNASAVLMRNSWEDKFFSMLMLGENGEPVVAGAGAVADGGMVGPTPLAPGATASNPMAPVTVSADQSMNMTMNNGMNHHTNDEMGSETGGMS